MIFRAIVAFLERLSIYHEPIAWYECTLTFEGFQKIEKSGAMQEFRWIIQLSFGMTSPWICLLYWHCQWVPRDLAMVKYQDGHIKHLCLCDKLYALLHPYSIWALLVKFHFFSSACMLFFLPFSCFRYVAFKRKNHLWGKKLPMKRKNLKIYPLHLAYTSWRQW